MFSILKGRKVIISLTLILSSANAFNSDQSIFLLFGKELHNSLSNNKILDQSNLKAFADDISNIVLIMIGITDWVHVRNIVRKGENAGYQHFLPFPRYFQKTSYSGSLKVGILW